ncbi:hypothetical protein [uncultured Cohaesibacter sp.]|uniref:hypothetical protein n=1 Tax=uncultured Cohaesibacter sp. TaxID=1002546 RepID=UPI00292F6E5F
MGEKVATRKDAERYKDAQQSGNYGQELVDRAFALLSDDTYSMSEGREDDASNRYPASGIYLY